MLGRKSRLLSRIVLIIVPGGIAAAALGAAAPAPDIPNLWSVEVVDKAAPSRPTYLCADRRMRESMTQALPEVEGKTCNVLEPPVVKGNHFQARCQSGDTIMVANSAVQGDAERDFTVVTDISTRPAAPSQAEPRGEFTQTRHYRLVGACPAGWSLGDSATQGATSALNALTGASRDLAAPFNPPSP